MNLEYAEHLNAPLNIIIIIPVVYLEFGLEGGGGGGEGPAAGVSYVTRKFDDLFL